MPRNMRKASGNNKRQEDTYVGNHSRKNLTYTQMLSLLINTFICCQKYKNVLRNVANWGVAITEGKKGGL